MAVATRREQILAAAARRFAAHGFHGVSIDEIGSDLGITGPALYHHFPSKDAILAELLIGISQTLLDEGRRRVEEATSPADAVEQLIAWHIDFAVEHPDLIVIQARDLASLSSSDRNQVRILQRRYVAVWTDVIVAYTGTDRANGEVAAHAAFGLLNSTPHLVRLPAQRKRRVLREMGHGALAAVRASHPVP
ncbi:MAG: TetR/AcrR family transcriptional regulator [Acidobacteriota bacterium]|nr:TetR/AcrR family transcriptional regulator [Acidobacteriota bacterium]